MVDAVEMVADECPKIKLPDSNNHAADQAYAKGIHRVFGGNLSIW